MWYKEYESVGDRISKAKKKLKKLQKKDPSINPITIEGKHIANTWWGKAWINNLKYYADYDNRLSRGRSYVKNGLVIHLAIKKSEIEAMVIGTSSTPYKIKININKLNENKWKKITELSHKQLHSLSELIDGIFPQELSDIFSNKSEGIFPSTKEMRFDCSCPDWANMCKHVSASLFATGKRLDEDPALIFKLRGVDINDLINKAVEKEVASISKKSNSTPENKLTLSEKKLGLLFNIKLSSKT